MIGRIELGLEKIKSHGFSFSPPRSVLIIEYSLDKHPRRRRWEKSGKKEKK